jgi:hypothetical protein
LLHKTRAPGKCKFFIWLALHDRCWTAPRTKNHHLQDDDCCVLCDHASKTITHLLVGCSFSRELWFALFRRWGWENRVPAGDELCLADWWTTARRRLPKEGKKTLDSILVLTCWMIWLERNARTFNRNSRSVPALLSMVLDEMASWSSAGYRSLSLLGQVVVGRQSSCVVIS